MQIEQDVIHRGRRPWWITFSEIGLIFNIIRKPNSMIICIIHSKCFQVPPDLVDFLQTFSLFPITVSGCQQTFFLADTRQKVDNIHRTIR